MPAVKGGQEIRKARLISGKARIGRDHQTAGNKEIRNFIAQFHDLIIAQMMENSHHDDNIKRLQVQFLQFTDGSRVKFGTMSIVLFGMFDILLA